MKLDVRLFGGLRERLGSDTATVELDEERATVDDLWAALVDAYPALEGMRDFVRVAVDRDFADGATLVEPDSEVALIPPVSGGSGEEDSNHGRSAEGSSIQKNKTEENSKKDAPGRISDVSEASDAAGTCLITRDVLEPAKVREHVVRPEAGAVVVFEGVVRDHTGDRSVTRLEYETYLEMALEKLVETRQQAIERFEDVEVAIHHRYGTLEIGEAAVAIATSSPHRKAAYEASRWIIDRLKEVVPIWKKEIGPDGAEWVGFGP